MPPPNAPESFRGLNLELAVTARRIMRFEVHRLLDVFEQVYFPSDEMLRDVAKQAPTSLTAVASAVCSTEPTWRGNFVNADLILPHQRLLYLGRVLDRACTQDMHRWRLDAARTKPQLRERIQRSGQLAIRRDAWMCTLPTLSDTLASPILTDAVRRYFAQFAPGLVPVPLLWLNDTEPEFAHTLEKTLTREAEATADSKYSLDALSREELSDRITEDPERGIS